MALGEDVGVEAHALEMEELVAPEVAEGAQLAAVAVAGAQQECGRVAAAVAHLGELDGDERERSEVARELVGIVGGGQPYAHLAARGELRAMLLPVRERHQHGPLGKRLGELVGDEPHHAPRIALDRALADHELTRHGRAPCRGRRAP